MSNDTRQNPSLPAWRYIWIVIVISWRQVIGPVLGLATVIWSARAILAALVQMHSGWGLALMAGAVWIAQAAMRAADWARVAANRAQDNEDEQQEEEDEGR